jgi:5-methylcytosine-specific restriction protein A
MCPGLSVTGWCDTHQHLTNADKQHYERARGSAHSRGYDRQWRKFRLIYLSQNPLCMDCKARGIIRLAEHIHHIAKLQQHPELKYRHSNLLGLCASDHDARTARGE